MDPARKLKMFNTLVAMGYKEIEVGFPSASQTDFDFVRQLIEDDLIPDDVTIQVLTQCREDLIRRTYESSAARARRSSTSTTRPPRCSARWCSAWTRTASPRSPSTPPSCAASSRTSSRHRVRYEYSPESYTGTEVEYAVEICDAVAEVIEPTPERS
jgi:2-isopropylmalate synthase